MCSRSHNVHVFGLTNILQLEVLHLCCPVATSSVYAIPDQVGDVALLFDSKSVEEIADCIRRQWLDDDLCRLLVGRGKKKASEWGQLLQFNEAFRKIIN